MRRLPLVQCGVVIGITVMVALACNPDAVFSPSFSKGTTTHQVNLAGAQRTYDLHVPKRSATGALGRAIPYPLVIVMHGSSGTTTEVRDASGMDSLSELPRCTQNPTFACSPVGPFVVAYPQGSQGGGGLFPSDWNAGTCCGAAFRENIDDLGFISNIITTLLAQKDPTIDVHRIYVAGFSDGGRMSHYVACRLSTSITAIGVVSGSLLDDHCAPKRAVPVFAVHGTTDPEVPYNDSAMTAPPRPVPAAASQLPSSMQYWIASNTCSAVSTTRVAPHVVRTLFSPCAGEVAFFSIEGGVHGWPGGPGFGPPMSEISASKQMLIFFSRQYRK